MQAFIKAIQDASLDKDNLDPAVRENLTHPIQEPLDLAAKPAILTSIELFLDTTTTSQNVYEDVCAMFTQHMQRINPGVEFELLSHYHMEGEDNPIPLIFIERIALYHSTPKSK